ncbi:MAG TPA: hypothetical protein VGB97_01390 [Candidatus Paceibacterota bacterium]|jgi:hypothetical protein
MYTNAFLIAAASALMFAATPAAAAEDVPATVEVGETVKAEELVLIAIPPHIAQRLCTGYAFADAEMAAHDIRTAMVVATEDPALGTAGFGIIVEDREATDAFCRDLEPQSAASDSIEEEEGEETPI